MIHSSLPRRYIPLVEFFELISFFGAVTFFAWLGYAPLQGQQQLDDVKDRAKAETNLYRITDHFFLSFLFCSIAAVSDYAVHYFRLTPDQRVVLLLGVGTAFLFGLFTLFVPMVYIRTVGRGGKDLGDINPPAFPSHAICNFLWSTCHRPLVVSP